MSNEKISAEAQPVGEVKLHGGLLYGQLDRDLPQGTKIYAHPPPSAPVGDDRWKALIGQWQRRVEAAGYDGVEDALDAAVAAKSAPVGVPVDVVREYLDARACYDAAARPPNSHAPAPVLKHGDPVVLRLREARVALDNAIALAQQPPAEAQAVGGGERKPDGFHYRYRDPYGGEDTIIRNNSGQEVNGSWPIEAVPYWYSAPPSAPEAQGGKEFDKAIEDALRCGTGMLRVEHVPQAEFTAPPSAPVGVEDELVRVGNLPTMNQDGYPGLGEWWVQLWRGDEIIARVYGDGPDEVRSQAQDIADALNQQPAAVEAVEEALQRWLDWCDEHGEQPEAASGARIALRAAALAAQQGGSDNDH